MLALEWDFVFFLKGSDRTYGLIVVLIGAIRLGFLAELDRDAKDLITGMGVPIAAQPGGGGQEFAFDEGLRAFGEVFSANFGQVPPDGDTEPGSRIGYSAVLAGELFIDSEREGRNGGAVLGSAANGVLAEVSDEDDFLIIHSAPFG